MASNIAVYYRFDTDDVINNTMRNAITGTYDATVMPGTITTANYFIGKSALNIDARNQQYATMPASLTIPQSGFSIAFWLSSNSLDDTNTTIFEFSNTSGDYGVGKYTIYLIINSNANIFFSYLHNSGTGSGTVTSTIAVEDTIWRHILITYTSSNVVSLYINGKLNARSTFSNYPANITYPVSYIGRNTQTTTYYYTGSIDDFRIYSYAITSEADINYLLYYPNYNIYTTSPSQVALLGNTISNFYDMNNVNASKIYSPRTILPGTVLLVSGKPNQNFDTGDLTASSTTFVLPSYCVFDRTYRNLYVCDKGANELKRINMYSGVVNAIYTHTNVHSVAFDVSGINYYLTSQSYIPQIDLSTNTFQQNINTNALINTNFVLTDNSNNLFISHATGIAKINLSGSLPTATSTVITTTVQMAQMCFKPSSQTNIYAIDASNTFIYVINKTTNANYKITLPTATFTNNLNTNISGLVFDSMENLYIGCVNGNNNIYIISYYVINAISTDTTLTADKIVLYAGSSSFGYSGDGGPCINAQFMSISNLSIDAGDNLYICDSGSYTIRKIINGGARKTNFMNMIANETNVVSNTASDLKTVYSGIYSIGGAGSSVSNYSNYCINNTSTVIETELQATTYNVIDNSGLLIYYKFNTMDTSGIQVANYGAGMPVFDASMSDTTMCSSNDYVVESGGLNMSATTIGSWSSIDSLPRSSILLPNNPSGFNYHGMSFGSWNGVAVSKNGLYVAGVGDFHNFYTNYNTNYNLFSQLYTVPTVELVGGTGTLGNAGDGGPVSKAQFLETGEYIFTPDGYYIANKNNIRFVNNQSIIRTICGSNTASSTGNFGLATSATINITNSISQDISKNYLYLSENAGNVVRRIDNKGIIYPFCGTGTASSTGDGGVAISATLNNPWGILTDTSNNVYVCEDTGARIRMIDFSTNIISKLAGTGTAGFLDNVAASAAQFNRPIKGVLDLSRNLYIADYNNNRIRKITAVNGVLSSSCIVSTICGTGTASSTGDGRLATLATLNFPLTVSFNSDYSYLYIFQDGKVTFRAINMKSGIINTVFGTGIQGTNVGNQGNPLLATTNLTYNCSFDPSNNIYFGTSTSATYVRRLTSLTSFPPFAKQPYDRVWALYGLSWKYISMSGTGQYQIAYMNNFGTYLSNGYGSLNSWDYIADLSGIYTNSAALSYTGQYQSVMDVYGNIYVSTRYGVNSSWTQRFVNTKNTNFTPMPAKIACSFDGKYQVATAFRHQQCVKIAGTGTPGFSGDTGQATSAQFYYQPTFRFDSSNNMIFADGSNHRVRRIATRTGIITTIAGTGTATFPAAGGTATAVSIQYPFGLIMDISNNYYIANYHGLVKVTGTTLAILGGSNTGTFAGDGAVLSTTTRFASPQGMFCDSFNNIYISDGGNRRIRKITATTNFVSTIAGTGTNSSTGDGGLATASTLNPAGICCDSFNNLYIIDTNRIRRIDVLSGIITTICGTGVASSTGDGGQAISATLQSPHQVCCDRANNLYIAEYGNGTTTGNRVRKVTARNGELNGTCIITTYAGNGTQVTGGDNGLPPQVGLSTCTSVSIDNYDNVYFNNNQICILYKATQYANVIVSSNYGQTWSDVTTNITGNIAFNNVATSQTGQYMTATSLNGRIYRSTNFGVSGSWAVSSSTIDNWGSVVVSNTGQYQIAAGYDMGGFYSTDFGLNWTTNGMPNGNWSSLALSESTNTLYAVSKNAGASGSTIYKNTAFNLPTSGLTSEWLTIHNPILKSASWPTNNGVSFSFWCKSNNNSTWARFFDFGNGQASDNILMGVNSNNIVISVHNSTTGFNQYTGIQINDNIWRHVCWTLTYATPNATNSIHTIYVNGINVYQQSNQTFTYYPNATARQFCYVGRSNWADPYFNGVIDDFRIYNRVLSNQEVFKLYSANECAHYYKFDSDYDFTNTQLANYNTVKPAYDGTQYTQDPNPPIITTATTVAFGTYSIFRPSINNLYGMALTQNGKRMFTIANNTTTFSFSDYNINLQRWNTSTQVTITSGFWTGIKASADGYMVVMCAATGQSVAGGLFFSVWNGTTYSTLTTIAASPTTNPRFYSGIELTANRNRLIAIADYVYFATWNEDTSNFINLTATALAIGSSFITYDALISQKYNMCGGIACNSDGSRIAYANTNNEIYFASWNGTTYVNPVLVSVLDPYATGMTMSYDGNLLFYSNVSDFSQKIFYSIWNGTTYTVQTELSYNLIPTVQGSTLLQFTPAATLYMALSYDMSTLYISTNSNSAYSDIIAPTNNIGNIYPFPLIYTNTSTLTKRVGTNALVVQRQNIINQPYLHTFTSSSAPVTNSFTVGTIGSNDISITSDKLRAVICGRSVGHIYVSTYNISTATWSALVAQTNQSAFTSGLLISAKITSDGSRGIAITNDTQYASASSCYFFTWNGSSYSAFTTTLGTTGIFVSCVITSNGSRIFVLKDGFINYADWNGSNYGAWTNTALAAVKAVSCNGTGTVITYMKTTLTLFVATFNGSSFVEQPVVATYSVGITCLKMNTNGTMIGIANSTGAYLQRLSINYTSAGAVNTIVSPAGAYNGYEITADNATMYAVSYTASAGTIYSSNLTLTYNNNSFIPYFTPTTQPFFVTTGVISISITQDAMRIAIANYQTGKVHYSTFNKTSGLWSPLIATLNTAIANSIIAIKITADGSRLVYASRDSSVGCYVSTWLPNTNNYSNGTLTLGSTTQAPNCLDMTADGSRIFIISTNGVYYANWNGSNYSAWISLGIAGSGINTNYIGCSGDGMRIVYNCNTTTLNYALWNGYTYIIQTTTIGSITAGTIRPIRLNYNGSIVYFNVAVVATVSTSYSFWNGFRYSNASIIPAASIPFSTDGWGLASSYDLKNIYLGAYPSVIYQTSTDLKAPTQASALTIPDTRAFIKSTGTNYTFSQPFTTPSGNIGFSITQNGLRVVIANHNTGLLYFSTFNGSVWSALTQTIGTALAASTLINVKITADGSRGVFILRGGTGLAYYFTWNGSNYSANTATLGATSSTYQTIDMTTDGSRIFTVDAAFVKYADWNGTNYGTWTNTSFTGSAIQTAAVGCSTDGYRIVYCCNTTTLNYAAWNGSVYVNISTFGTVLLSNIRAIRFTSDNNYVFYSQTSASPFLFFSAWNGTGFGSSNSVPLSGITGDGYPLAISYDMTTIYVGIFLAVNGIYQVPLTLTTVYPNMTGLTFSFWFKSIATPDYGGLITLQSIYGWILMYILGDTVYAAINEQKAVLPAAIYPTNITKNSIPVATIQQNTWNHIAWTIQQVNVNYDVSGAGIWNVYLNGNSVYQNTNQIYPYPGTRTTNFVGYNGQSNIFMNGNMDDYRAYNRVLSVKEINSIYVNSPNVIYEKTAILPAGIESEIGGTYTFSTGNAIPTLIDYTTIYQYGAYVLSNSSNLVNIILFYMYNAFDNNPNTFTHTQQIYNLTTGVYTGSIFTNIQGVGNTSGEWYQIQIPYSLQVSSYIITNRDIPNRFPGTWYLLGSNNGADWYPIDYKIGITYTTDTVTFTPNQSNTNYYSYFRFVWIVVGGTPYTSTRESINLVAIKFSGAARYSNYFYYKNAVKTYIPRLQSNLPPQTFQNTSNATITTTSGLYTILVFFSSGVITVSNPGSTPIYYLVVGGGGSGGHDTGGGGGAGGVLQGSITLASIDTITVTIGQGGIAGGYTVVGVDGGNSSIIFTRNTRNNKTAIGGGGGGYSGIAGRAGGSGGGAGWNNATGGTGTVGPPIQGFNGGNNGAAGIGGGGGGASAVGSGKIGGAGIIANQPGISTYYPTQYWGGGGGGGVNGGGGAGGIGGGGGGADSGAGGGTAINSGATGQTGTSSFGGAGGANTGGGGGGGRQFRTGGNGGSGIVVIAYLTLY